MLGLGEGFKGFGSAAFLAFEPRKWTSNLFNMERMAVREQLRAIGTAIQPVVAADRAFAWDVTPHMPSVFNGKKVGELVLYFTRTAEQQKAIAPLLDSRISLPDQISDAGEHHRHGTLGVRIAQDGVQVGLMVHSTAWLDVMNLLNRCKDHAESERLIELVRALPGSWRIQVDPRTEIAVGEFANEHVRRLEEAVLNETFLIFAGRRFGPDDAEIGSAGFPGLCGEVLRTLLPLWDFVAWRPASNYLVATQSQRPVAASVVAESPHVLDLAKGVRVRITDGVFAGRSGIVMDIDGKGSVRVLLGKVSIRTDVRSIRAV